VFLQTHLPAALLHPVEKPRDHDGHAEVGLLKAAKQCLQGLHVLEDGVDNGPILDVLQHPINPALVVLVPLATVSDFDGSCFQGHVQETPQLRAGTLVINVLGGHHQNDEVFFQILPFPA